MNDEPRDLREEELAFFGRIGADVTHDMRNILSVIREYSGLLRDLISTATRKKPLDPEQLRKLSEKITDQVRNGTELMERFSRFAHAADERIASFDLTALTRNTAALAQRSVKLARCTLDLELPEEPIPVRSNPLSLQHAVFSALQLILESSGPGGTVTVGASRRAPVAVISVAARAAPDGPPPSVRIDGVTRRMQELDGGVETASDQGTLHVRLTIPIDTDPA